ncbi:MAG: hypothetical protein ACRES8_01485 [Nevskiaceae bacterium]
MRTMISGRRAVVPDDLDDVVTIDRAAECDPKDVGLDPARVEAVWDAVEDLYRTGLQPAMTLVVRRQGRVVLSAPSAACAATCRATTARR